MSFLVYNLTNERNAELIHSYDNGAEFTDEEDGEGFNSEEFDEDASENSEEVDEESS